MADFRLTVPQWTVRFDTPEWKCEPRHRRERSTVGDHLLDTRQHGSPVLRQIVRIDDGEPETGGKPQTSVRPANGARPSLLPLNLPLHAVGGVVQRVFDQPRRVDRDLVHFTRQESYDGGAAIHADPDVPVVTFDQGGDQIDEGTVGFGERRETAIMEAADAGAGRDPDVATAVLENGQDPAAGQAVRLGVQLGGGAAVNGDAATGKPDPLPAAAIGVHIAAGLAAYFGHILEAEQRAVAPDHDALCRRTQPAAVGRVAGDCAHPFPDDVGGQGQRDEPAILEVADSTCGTIQSVPSWSVESALV